MLTLSTEPTEQLVARCRTGDDRAFSALVQRFQNAAYATALSLNRDVDEAQEVVQEAFIAAYCKLGQLRDGRRFPGWLRQIVRTRSIERARERAVLVQRHVSIDASEAEMAEVAARTHEDTVRRSDLWDTVAGLPEHYRTAVYLHYLSGMSYKEIAAYLEVAVSTVRGRLQQSRIRLRNVLTEPEIKAIEMKKVDLVENVEESVCKIATAQIDQHFASRERIVLFCGLDVDLSIEQSDGDETVLTGSKAALGMSPESVAKSLDNIEILIDEVDDFITSGPHPGEVFTGTSSVQGKQVACTASTRDVWERLVNNRNPKLNPDGLFPFLDPGGLFALGVSI